MPGHRGSLKHDSVREGKDPVPLFPVTIEDVADLFPLPRPLVHLVAAGHHPVYPGEEGGAEVLDELVRADLQAGAGRLVLLSPANIQTFSHV